MNRNRILVVVGSVAVLAVAFWFWKGRGRAEAPRYRTAALEQGDLTATVSATGSVRPVVQVQVGSQVSGTISDLRADYNSRVHAGQVLAQIEPSSFRTRVVQAEASLARAEAAYQEARRKATRAQELLVGNFVSEADVEVATSEVDQRKADRMQAEAQLSSAKLDLEHTTIRSPIDGVVISRSVDVGQTVAASLQAPELFVIANDLRQMQVETRIDEADIGRIHAGLPVRFTVDAFPDDTFEGNVSQVRLEPITEQNVVTYTTVMGTRNEDLRLRPGMTANVTVLVESKAGVLKVPNAALRFKPSTLGDGRGGAARASADGARGSARGGAGSASAATVAPGGAAGAGGARQAGAAEARQGRAGGTRQGGAPSARREGADGAGQEGASRPATKLEGGGLRPGTVYVLRDGKPVALQVRTGISDGAFTEVQGEGLSSGTLVVLGLDVSTSANRGAGLAPPPGMGGQMMRPGGRR